MNTQSAHQAEQHHINIDTKDVMKIGEKKVNLLIGHYDNRKHHHGSDKTKIEQATKVTWLGD